MSGVIWHITMSLDGFIAGPNDSMDWGSGATMGQTLVTSSLVIWHITMSLDGFIAGPNDSMDWASGATKGPTLVTSSLVAARSRTMSCTRRVRSSVAAAGGTWQGGSTTASMGSTAASGAGQSSCSRTVCGTAYSTRSWFTSRRYSSATVYGSTSHSAWTRSSSPGPTSRSPVM